MAYWDIDPQDIDPDTGRPYSNYSSPSLDTSFHDHEMQTELTEAEEMIALLESGKPLDEDEAQRIIGLLSRL